MKKTLTITAAILFMVGGLWWQFVGSSNRSTSNEPDSSTTATTDTTQTNNITNPEDYYDQDNPTNPTADTIGGETEQKNLATDDDLNRCVPVQNGFGIEMKDWGNIRLPYGDTWPKNEPGQPVDCAPDTDFGAAVVAAHALFIESMSPELIPEIALATPARQLRIDQHSGKYDPAELNGSCTPLGWKRPQQGISIWHIFHQCGEGPINVTPVRMQNDTGKWLMVYNIDGQIIINEAEPNTQYFPFEGGD